MLQEKLDKIAYDVMVLSRNTLLVNLRFMDMALSSLEYFPCEEPAMLTDGKYLLYNSKYVLGNFKHQKETPVRDYMHIVMHCVYRHMFVNPSVDRPLWDLACDIAIENAINELNLKSVENWRVATQLGYIEDLKRKVSPLTAEKLYAHFKSNPSDKSKLERMKEAFFADNHEIWYMSETEKENTFGITADNSGQGEDGDDGDGGDSGISLSISLSEEWKKIAERMQVEMETFAKMQGDRAGSLMQNLKEVNRERYDYTAFLKKFATMGEVMKVNDDEFDYIFYTYGLKLYEKMPLIEPLEYKEVKRIKEFVIAIDTSGSTSGDTVQKFVQKTYNILKSTESFFSKINLHIIQCDAEIQKDVKITNQDEFDEYIRNMKIHGLGGTDFRPVFAYVDEFIKNKEFNNLKGLIYFTDGWGEFPHKKPDYETAFVFVDDDYNNYDVPPWAIKLILREDEI